MGSANTDRVLIIEDDQDSLAALFTLLTNAGYSVLTAENGQDALDFFERGIIPRLVIADLMLPKVDGRDLLKHFAEDPHLRHVPVIVTTALDPRQVRVVADAVFRKPLDFNELIATVRRLYPSGAPGAPSGAKAGAQDGGDT